MEEEEEEGAALPRFSATRRNIVARSVPLLYVPLIVRLPHFLLFIPLRGSIFYPLSQVS